MLHQTAKLDPGPGAGSSRDHPSRVYAYYLACQRPKDDDAYGMQGVAYEMHTISLADSDGQVLNTLELRREKQVQVLLRMLTSTVDIDVERA